MRRSSCVFAHRMLLQVEWMEVEGEKEKEKGAQRKTWAAPDADDSSKSNKHHALAPHGANSRDRRMEISFLVDSQSSTGVKRGSGPRNRWTKEEDTLLETLVAKHGAHGWKRFEVHFQGRRGTHLRSHYKHSLELKAAKRPFTLEEDNFILDQARNGVRWCEIARKMDRRVDNDIKNRYRHLSR
mmetsp:Transcript_12753/g.27813  ORF Transcript_12753/g.27813 Transcript_12753/m.27813 type:complete len:184 (+) Transcript_12753:124-675(+)